MCRKEAPHIIKNAKKKKYKYISGYFQVSTQKTHHRFHPHTRIHHPSLSPLPGLFQESSGPRVAVLGRPLDPSRAVADQPLGKQPGENVGVAVTRGPVAGGLRASF